MVRLLGLITVWGGIVGYSRALASSTGPAADAAVSRRVEQHLSVIQRVGVGDSDDSDSDDDDEQTSLVHRA